MKRCIYILSFFLINADLLAQIEIPNNDKVVLVNEVTINTKEGEYSPAFYENGIVFISADAKSTKKSFDERQGKKSSSIQIARRGPQGFLNEPEVFAAELTTAFNEGPVSFNRENNIVFYSTNYQKDGKKLKAKDGFVKQKIQMATEENDKWTNVQDLPFNNVEFSNIHPTLSVDGITLYFASNRPDGFGGMDIYVCRKIGDSWGEAVNLGSTVNSNKDEVFPYIHPDGTLYFSSNGQGGVGAMDVFYSKFEKGAFQNPKNIGKPFNSESDDFGFILDLERKNGYLTSNRVGGKGEDDIYSFSSSEKVGEDNNVTVSAKPIVIYTADKLNSKDIEGVAIKIMPLSDYEIGDLVTDNDGNVIRLITTDSTNILTSIDETQAIALTSNVEGKSQTKLKNGDYLVAIAKKGYQLKQTIFNVSDTRDEFMMLLEPLQAEALALNGVLKNNRGLPIANATITLTDDAGGEPQVFRTDAKGNYKYYVKPNTTYTLSATKDNYLSNSVKFNTANVKDGNAPQMPPINIDMTELDSPLPTGKVFQLNNVYYNYNDATLRPDARKDLDPLVALLKTYSEVEIELSSHTDSRGGDDYNLKLSQKRAESVVKYLMDKGIAASRLRAVGYGETQLRNQCNNGVNCSDKEHQVNRRTEVKVTRGGNGVDVSVLDKLFTDTQNDRPTINTNVPPTKTNPSNNATAVSNNSNANVPATKGNTKVVTTDNGWSPSGGLLWVVAGSYREPKNADDQLTSLLAKGYNNSVIVYAEDIQFYRVVVETGLDNAKALKLYKKLRAERKDAFLLR